MSARSELVLKLNQHLKRSYTNSNGESVFLYIGYWEEQTGHHQSAKHSPKLCLPANGWEISHKEKTNFTSKDFGTFSSSNILGSLRGSSQLFRYWFFIGREMFEDENKVLLKTTLSKVTGKRSDGGIIEITTDVKGDEASRLRLLDKFQKDLLAQLNTAL